ncbi:geranylgeranyl transferase type-1 subunit beta-like [Plakobranchus ocellatus]|uniref:Geranylgeranyl transferase type-1 subunit beta n=1 Tax=Plakobranchus ocellatus TaxID=259542 RepID=A0AAV3XUR4_9GAST|nr:geranylgeranyl transferase type-1 subunit beta-like [Plakobranchus ocellatus]
MALRSQERSEQYGLSKQKAALSTHSKHRDELFHKKHAVFFKRVLQVLPSQQLDTHRVSLAYFAISGLDLLDSLNDIESDRERIIEWIYSLQVQPNESGSNLNQCGFRGCPMLGHAYDTEQAKFQSIPYDSSNIAMTYTALATLLILGDDLSRVHKKAVLQGVKSLQQPNGSFVSVLEGSEYDMRFVYCASCICYMLNDWSGMDVDKAVSYIVQSLSYEGAFGQRPYNEAHGGSTFCAVGSLILMDRLHVALSESQLSALRRWLLHRQDAGFTGRPNKTADTCYSFWVGAALEMLGVLDLTHVTFNRSFVLSAQEPIVGGFSKYPDHPPDPLHSYLGLAGLSLIGEPNINPIYPALNISQRAYDHLMNLHRQWEDERSH